ncbi:unnamed protein product, partial [Symbiodinium microadriaticum]
MMTRMPKAAGNLYPMAPQKQPIAPPFSSKIAKGDNKSRSRNQYPHHRRYGISLELWKSRRHLPKASPKHRHASLPSRVE